MGMSFSKDGFGIRPGELLKVTAGRFVKRLKIQRPDIGRAAVSSLFTGAGDSMRITCWRWDISLPRFQQAFVERFSK